MEGLESHGSIVKMLRLVPVGLSLATVMVAWPAGGAGASTAGHPHPGTAAHPHIVVNPDSQMVNRPVELVGSGFPPSQKLTIAECAEKTWVVPEKPPCAGNAIRVKTGRSGAFKAEMTASLCGAKPVLTSQKCFVGWPHPSGVDTVQLVGAAKLVVTYP